MYIYIYIILLNDKYIFIYIYIYSVIFLGTWHSTIGKSWFWSSWAETCSRLLKDNEGRLPKWYILVFFNLCAVYIFKFWYKTILKGNCKERSKNSCNSIEYRGSRYTLQTAPTKKKSRWIENATFNSSVKECNQPSSPISNTKIFLHSVTTTCRLLDSNRR